MAEVTIPKEKLDYTIDLLIAMVTYITELYREELKKS